MANRLTRDRHYRYSPHAIYIILSSHYSDVIMSAMASQITDVPIVCSTVCSGANKRKHQSSASLAFVRGIHQWRVESFPFDDVIMKCPIIGNVPLSALSLLVLMSAFIVFTSCTILVLSDASSRAHQWSSDQKYTRFNYVSMKRVSKSWFKHHF